MAGIKSRLDQQQRKLTDMQHALTGGRGDLPRLPAEYNRPDVVDFHAGVVLAVRELLTEFRPEARVAEAEHRAQRAIDENWGQGNVTYYAEQAEEERRQRDFWRHLHTLTPDNATDMYTAVLVAAFGDSPVMMVPLYFQIAANRWRLWDTPSGRYEGQAVSELSPRVFAHLPDDDDQDRASGE